MYTISTSPGGRAVTATTIRDALAALASQLESQLPHGAVAWKITGPTGIDHRGSKAVNGRLDLLAIAVDELYTQLHRAVDGGPPRSAKPAE